MPHGAHGEANQVCGTYIFLIYSSRMKYFTECRESSGSCQGLFFPASLNNIQKFKGNGYLCHLFLV